MTKINETQRLILREYTLDDYDTLYKIISDPVTMQHYPKPYDEVGVRRWLEWSISNYKERGFGWWAVISKETGELMGDCGITLQIINGEILPEIGYHFDKKFWRKGFGTEAAKAVRDWAFKNTDYNSLYSYMTQKNVGSYSVAEAIGMERVGAYTDEKYGDMYVYAITREAWKNVKED